MTLTTTLSPRTRGLVVAINRLYRWACERLYHEFAWSYDLVSWGVSFGRWRQWRDAVWPHVVGPQVLELGPGPGHTLTDGHRRGFAMTGVELSPDMVTVARRNTAAAGLPCILARADGRQLPFAAGSFDTVLATFPAGYILDPATIAESSRVLRPGGCFVIAGLWVSGPPWTRLIPVFYGEPSCSRRAALAARFRGSGFEAEILDLPAGDFRIGAIVAQKAR